MPRTSLYMQYAACGPEKKRTTRGSPEADELAVGLFCENSCSCRRYCSYSPGGYVCLFASMRSASACVQRSATGRDCLEGREGESDSTEGEQARACVLWHNCNHQWRDVERRGQDALELELLRRGGGVVQWVECVVFLRLLQLCALRVGVAQGRRVERVAHHMRPLQRCVPIVKGKHLVVMVKAHHRCHPSESRCKLLPVCAVSHSRLAFLGANGLGLFFRLQIATCSPLPHSSQPPVPRTIQFLCGFHR